MKSSRFVFTVAVLALLLLVSDLVVFSSFGQSTTGTNGAPKDLLQYEWPQFQGGSSFTRFSAGPAPEAPDILWKTNLTGIQSYISAFNGMVFVTANTTVYALNRETGATIWHTTVASPGRWPAVYKIDDSHMVVGNACLDPATGQILWTSGNFSTNANTFSAGVYSPEEKMFYVKIQSYVNAWDFSDPSQPPTLAWQTYVPGGGSVGSSVQYGDGKVFPGSSMSHQMALNARTGAVLWDTETKAAMLFAGTYYEGKFFRGTAHDNTFYAFDADTGETLWTFDPGTPDGYWVVGSAAAYGMVYELNKDGYLYALDVNTGNVVWKYKGPGPLFFPGNPVIADGKIYATTGQQSSFDPTTGNYSLSEFVALDAYTGRLIWTLPIEAYSPRESTAIAYGNLYIIPGYVQAQQMDQYTTLNQVWAIGTRGWSMWRHDPAHTGAGQSGPMNLTLRWNFTTGGAVVSSPSVADGIAYFGSQDKNIYAVDARDGDFIWKFATGNRIESSPAVANGKVYTGTDDGYVYCLDAYNGSLIWKTFAGGYVPANFNAAVILRSSPVVVGGIVYVGSLDNKTYALNANSGNVTWAFQTNGYITSSPAVVNGTVYVLSQEPGSGGLYLLNAATGNEVKRITVPYQQTNRGTDLMSSPTVAEGMIFVASNKKAYYGINATTGAIQWTYKDDAADEFIICSPIYDNGKLYIIDEFYIVALNAQNGSTLWKSFVGAELYVSPAYADGKLYVITDQRSMYVLNASDGQKLSFFLTNSNSWSSPTLYEGRLYVGDNDWNVYSLANYPILNSNITIALDKSDAFQNELVTGFGVLAPRLLNATVMVTLTRPDSILVELRVATSEPGYFTFTFAPNMVGNWTVSAQWLSDKSYYSSAASAPVSLTVNTSPTPIPTETPPPTPTPTASPTPSPSPSPTPTPFEELKVIGIPILYVYASVIVGLVVVIAVAGFALRKRNEK